MALKVHPSSIGTQQRWNGTRFPIPPTMPEQFDRLSRYPITALSTGALFAVAMAGYPDPRQIAVSKRRDGAE